MFYNEIFNIIIFVNIIMLTTNIQILQSIPAIKQYPQADLYDRRQKLCYKEKSYVNKINRGHPEPKRFLTHEELQQKNYERKVNKINKETEKLFDRDGQRVAKFRFKNDDNNEIFLNNNANNYFNEVNKSWSCLKKFQDSEAPINNYKNYYDYHPRHRYNYNDLNLFDNEINEDLNMLKYLTPNPPFELKTQKQIHRRQTLTKKNPKKQFEKSSLHPTVITKTVKINLRHSTSCKSGDNNILENGAQKINTSTADLASNLAKSAKIVDSKGQFSVIAQGHMKNNVTIASNNVTPNQKLAYPLNALQTDFGRKYADYENIGANFRTLRLGTILEEILNKLDNIRDTNDNDNDEHPDAAPCEVIGTWISSTLGLCFDIKSYNDKIRDISPGEINNNILVINCKECTPAKHHHQLCDLQWKFRGSALKQFDGPLYIYGQKTSENVAATFLGFCRTCGGIDTIFGSWTILTPSKDCNDIPLAFEIKRDVLRRSQMERKRKERFTNVLYQSRLD